MLDNPEKTTRLLTALKAAAPFEVEVLPSVVKHLQIGKSRHHKSNPSSRVGFVVCGRRRRDRVPHRPRRKTRGTHHVFDARPRAAHQSACESGYRLSEAPDKEIEEAGPHVERIRCPPRC